MSRIVAAAAIRGSRVIYNQAQEFYDKALAEKSADTRVEFPETAYFLPMAYTLLGIEAKTLDDIRPILAEAKSLLHEAPADSIWLPYLGNALDAGIATLLSEEVIVALRYLYGQEPQPDCEGFYTDTWMRTLGIQLVDGRMPGFAAILGAAPTNEIAVKVVRELQKRSILIFPGSSTNGVSIIDQLLEEGIEMSWDTYIVPYGRDTISAIYPLNWAIRAALTFGGLDKGSGAKALRYTQARVFAFGLTLGEIDDVKYATGLGAVNMGFPVIADTDIPEIRPSGICTYEHLVKELDYDKIVPTCIEVRGVKVTMAEIDIPVPYSPAFEGESVRKEYMQVQSGQRYSTAFEYLNMVDMDAIEDGHVELIGPDIDDFEEGAALPLAIRVEVAGRKMQKDFEPILERRIHTYVNQAMGVMHVGQRNITWVRISKDAFASGFRYKHIGTILHHTLHDEFGEIADKVAVTLYTRQEDVDRLLLEATVAYGERDARVAGMTDDSVELFYSCTLCQSFAPDHVCVITPERLGLCGAYNWLDGKASYEINPHGVNQPIQKGPVIDAEAGEWEGVNAAVKQFSHGTLDRFSAYSLLKHPMTSCGCFECIVAMLPEVNGFMVVNREFPELTPCGAKFTTLAGMVGGGKQTPGFLGVGRLYVVSKKFIFAEGGLKRLVWLTKELKEYLREPLLERCEEIGELDLLDKIADEDVGLDVESVMAYAEEKGHPALTMPSLLEMM